MATLIKYICMSWLSCSLFCKILLTCICRQKLSTKYFLDSTGYSFLTHNLIVSQSDRIIFRSRDQHFRHLDEILYRKILTLIFRNYSHTHNRKPSSLIKLAWRWLFPFIVTTCTTCSTIVTNVTEHTYTHYTHTHIDTAHTLWCIIEGGSKYIISNYTTIMTNSLIISSKYGFMLNIFFHSFPD